MKALLLLIGLTAFIGLLQIPVLQMIAQWDRSAIIDGQWWRIVTGNLTHTNLFHLGMNLFGLWFICFIFRAQLYWQSLLLLIIGLSFSVGGLLLLTSMQVYVGLSGVLHGLFAFYAIQEYRLGRKSSAYLVAGLVLKIIWEQCFGSPTGSESLIQAKVAINAHLFGAVAGSLIATMIRPRRD